MGGIRGTETVDGLHLFNHALQGVVLPNIEIMDSLFLLRPVVVRVCGVLPEASAITVETRVHIRRNCQWREVVDTSIRENCLIHARR